MFEFKSLTSKAIPRSLDKAEHYRLLNEPRVAESICHDILQIDPENQRALITLILAITDQFNSPYPVSMKQATDLIPKLKDEYDAVYYSGIIYERQAKTKLEQHYPDCEYDAYDFFLDAMAYFEKAEPLEDPDSDDAILRWNACARIITEHKLKPRPEDDFKPYLE